MLQDVNQMEWDTCQSTIIFLYLHQRPPTLSLCVYLGRGCSRISSVLPWPLPLPSTQPTQVAFLPVASQTGLYQLQRLKEREDGKGGLKQQKAKEHRGGKKFSAQCEENLSFKSYWPHKKHSLPSCSYCHCKSGQTFEKSNITMNRPPE